MKQPWALIPLMAGLVGCGQNPAAQHEPASAARPEAEIGRYQLHRESGSVGTLLVDSVTGDVWMLVPMADPAPEGYDGPTLDGKPLMWDWVPFSDEHPIENARAWEGGQNAE